MIPPIQGSNLFQDSSLNRTTRENCYIVGYKGPNEILEAFPKITRNILSVVQVLDLEDETVTRGILFNFGILNSPVTGHLGKMIISTNW